MLLMLAHLEEEESYMLEVASIIHNSKLIRENMLFSSDLFHIFCSLSIFINF